MHSPHVPRDKIIEETCQLLHRNFTRFALTERSSTDFIASVIEAILLFLNPCGKQCDVLLVHHFIINLLVVSLIILRQGLVHGLGTPSTRLAQPEVNVQVYSDRIVVIDGLVDVESGG